LHRNGRAGTLEHLMMPSHSPQQSAIASELAVELAEYEAGLHRLLRERWEPALYRELSDRFDRMQMYAAALPQVAVSFSELLISRVELMQTLWGTPGLPPDSSMAARYAQHQTLVREVMRKCVRYLTLPETPALSGGDPPPGASDS
jgi:hypothetical protein